MYTMLRFYTDHKVQMQNILYIIASLLGVGAMIVGALAIFQRDSGLLPVALAIFVATGIVVIIALVFQYTQR